ncbi:MAG: type II toxin-antitoxin system HicA family toxin [Rhodospirillaceae bacterium]|nr:type II toxin-antitoxin system HicA family toxin [Rhodospirillaceae bacterium]MYH36652.1 type II toxin-antitoxin system HicA family toxin [Rhodospirillaceae bacterium]MYK13442.1 type II toxin-antitoxin system HicA family toxin [Rhodospirillaceae bacterium]MYK57370.1 type II toxin-antitoxin system HicA family toxin [Rhodospirillaceae bacterium]
MARLRRLTSREVLRIFRGFGFEIVSIRGSHAKLVRVTVSGERQVLTVPVHSKLQVGTIRAIYRQASRFIDSVELQRDFFSD